MTGAQRELQGETYSREKVEAPAPVRRKCETTTDERARRRPDEWCSVEDAELGTALVRVVHVGERAGSEAEDGGGPEGLDGAHGDKDGHGHGT